MKSFFIGIIALLLIPSVLSECEKPVKDIGHEQWHSHKPAWKVFTDFKGVETQKCFTLSTDSVTIEYYNGTHNQTHYQLISEE